MNVKKSKRQKRQKIKHYEMAIFKIFENNK